MSKAQGVEAPRGWRRRNKWFLVGWFAVFAAFAVGAFSSFAHADVVGGVGKSALASCVLLVALGERIGSNPIAFLGVALSVVGLVSQLLPGTVGRVLGVRTLDSGRYTFTVTVERSSLKAFPVGEEHHVFDLERDGSRLWQGDHIRTIFTSLRVEGPLLRGWIGTDLYLEGECPSFGVAQGSVKSPTEAGSQPAVMGRFLLVRDGPTPSP